MSEDVFDELLQPALDMQRTVDRLLASSASHKLGQEVRMQNGVVIGSLGSARYVAELDQLRAELRRSRAVLLEERDFEELKSSGCETHREAFSGDDELLPETWKLPASDDPASVYQMLVDTVMAVPGYEPEKENSSWERFAIFQPSSHFGLPYWEVHRQP